jgi:hypothetical protein
MKVKSMDKKTLKLYSAIPNSGMIVLCADHHESGAHIEVV